MAYTLFEKIVRKHLVEGKPHPGEEIAIKVDQTLTQDATGTLVYLEFEKIGVDRVKTELSVSYVDHNMLQTDFRNADDHLFLQTIAMKYGIYFSRPGNGICHQVHLERFAAPGKTLIGSDSHTPTAGGVGSLAIGAGGLDVASSMAGFSFRFRYPEIVGVKLTGRLRPWVTAKDVVLELLRRVSVKGGVGKAFEYFGPGVKTLTVPERATITNMGVETGATTSIFPSDEVTRMWLRAQDREEQWVPLKADEGSEYDDVIEIDLSELEPLAALPHSPDNVKPVSEIEGTEIQQVAIGSCTNSSYKDLKIVAHVLDGRKVHENLSLLINPGSRQVVLNLIASGDFFKLVKAGARILENACGPCIGMGGAPPSNSLSLRTYNRNFKGRCGTLTAGVILASPEVAAVSAVSGYIRDPKGFGQYPEIRIPEKFIIDDGMIIPPLPREKAKKVEIRRGPNIKSLPDFDPLPSSLEGEVLIKLGDNVTTDDILPGGAKVLPYRSNIVKISEFIFSNIDPSFYKRVIEKGGGFIVGGENYGQGSSREHAALVPRYLGIRMVIAKSFARIHRANLINFGVVPALFRRSSDYELVDKGDVLQVDLSGLESGSIIVENISKNTVMELTHDLTRREEDIIRKGGLLSWMRLQGGVL
jgi:aconitate hydratase